MKLRYSLSAAAACLLVAASLASAQKPNARVDLDRGLQALESGAPVPAANRPLPGTDLHAQLTGAQANVAPDYVEPAEFGVMFQFDGSRSELEAAGIRVGTQVGNLFTARIRRDEVGKLRMMAGIHNAQLSRFQEKHLNLSRVDVHVDQAQNATPGSPPTYNGYAGQNMICGDVDSGIDWTKGDFKDPLTGLTRILYIWDQTDAVGPNPSGFAYGSEFTKAQIDGTPASVREKDTDGHGTNVAGVMIGNGSETGCSQPAYRYVGMAPLAQFVEVKTDFSDAGIIDGVNYIFQKAAALGKDCVVNLSLGSNFGGHDGGGTFSLAVQALQGPGKVVVASAGNAGGSKIHGKLTTTSTTVGTDRFTFTIPSYTNRSGTFNDYVLVTGWYPVGSSYTIRVKGPSAADTLSCPFNNNKDKQLTVASTKGGKLFIANQSAFYGYGGTARGNQFEIEVYDSLSTNAPRNGTWEIDVVSNGAANIGQRVDMWIYGSTFGSGALTATQVLGLDNTTLVGEPADADSLFSIAAHTTKASWPSCTSGGTCAYTTPPPLNAIASFSSPGPRRDGAQKPDLSAPGFGVATTHSVQSTATVGACDADDGQHQVNQGTSFSAPHVSGCVLLYLQCHPGANPTWVKQVFEQAATVDLNTGAVPNNLFGYGKMNVYNTLDHTNPAVALSQPNGGENLAIGSSYAINWNATDNVAVTNVKIEYSTDGGSSWSLVVASTPNTGTYAWIVPGPVNSQSRVRITAADCGNNQGVVISALNFTMSNPTAVAISDVEAAAGHGYVDLNWNVSVQGTAVMKVFRATSASGPFSAVSSDLASSRKTQYSFRDANVQPSTEYWYKLGWKQTGDWSYTSPMKSVTPVAVFGLRSLNPNPSRGVTRVDYELSRSGQVSLEVYNLSGARVRLLVSGSHQAGTGSANWDGRNQRGESMPAGPYFVRLTSGGQSASKKLVLVK